MYNSIQHFIEKGVKNIENDFSLVIDGKLDYNDFSIKTTKEGIKFIANFISELIEKVDEELISNENVKKDYLIERRNVTKKILDVCGELSFSRTCFKDKRTKKQIYLVDKILNFKNHQRQTLASESLSLLESLQTSYRKGGLSVSLTDDKVSKQTVKKAIHGLDFSVIPENKVKEKKKVKKLYIIADEDHISAQFNEKKGDLELDKKGRKINTIIGKTIIVYEGYKKITGEISKKPRYKLINKHIFNEIAGNYKENEEFWEEVREYIVTTYDEKEIEEIFIMGDGAFWIKTGLEVIEKTQFVLDKFHLVKAINNSVSHLEKEKQKEFKEEIWKSIYKRDKESIKNSFKNILNLTDRETNKYEVVNKALIYIISNWEGIEIRSKYSDERFSCSAEGQVSHILSSRMSSRPMGWSKLGCNKMIKLRAYYLNGGNILDLLKYKELKNNVSNEKSNNYKYTNRIIKNKQNAKYINTTQCTVPGIESSSLKWLKDLIDVKYGA